LEAFFLEAFFLEAFFLEAFFLATFFPVFFAVFFAAILLASCDPWAAQRMPSTPEVCCTTYIATYCDVSKKKMQWPTPKAPVIARKGMQTLLTGLMFTVYGRPSWESRKAPTRFWVAATNPLKIPSFSAHVAAQRDAALRWRIPDRARVKTMQKRQRDFGRKFRNAASFSLLMLAVACGYSQEEWDQKLRENENLQQQLKAQTQQNQKCDADYQSALAEIQDLKKTLLERGVNLENLTQSLEQQERALKEYQSRAAQLEQIRQRFELLRQKLQKLTELGLSVEVRDNRMLIQLPGDVLFASGEEKLTKEGEEILTQVAAVVRSDADLSKREFQVAGHTDNVPMRRGPLKDNWGLSAMRARSVLAFLITPLEEKGGGLLPENWSAAGYASTDPVANNDSDEGRAKNRRVELVVLPNVEEMLNLNSLAR
jgi:chemotaxis protein MotB